MFKIFVIRPVLTTLLTLSIVILGIISWYKISVNSLPKTDFPVILINASLPGASAKTMAEAVALPIEQRLTEIEGVKSIRSTSSLGKTQVIAEFELSRNIDAAAQDINNALSLAAKNLPSEMTSLPTYKKLNPSEMPIVYLSLASKTMTMSEVNRYAKLFVIDQISTILGVAQVDIFGEQKYAVRIYPDPKILGQKNISFLELSNAVASANLNPPTGYLEDSSQNLNPSTRLYDAKGFSKIYLRENLQLADVAKVEDGVEDNRVQGWYKDEPGVVLAVSKQSGANTIEVAQKIIDKIERINKQLPASLKLRLIANMAEHIQESVQDVQWTFILTLVLVVLVVGSVLGRASLIPGISLPIAIFASFALMYWMNFSLNNLTLLALTLSLGFIIDDAIVVVENIAHKVHRGVDRFNAAIIGTNEIVFTIISMSMSLIAVFIPIIFLPGIIGRLFLEFGLTMIIVIITSAFVSLTLVPMLCARYLKIRESLWFNKLQDLYRQGLDWSMQHQKLMLGCFALFLILNIGCFIYIPKGFLPTEDTNFILCTAEANPNISFTELKEAQQNVIKTILSHPAVELTSGYAGIPKNATASGSTQGRLFVGLKKPSVRKPIEEIIKELREKLSQNPVMQIYMQPIQNIRFSGNLSKSQYEYTLVAASQQELIDTIPKMIAAFKNIPGIIDVTSDMNLNNSEISLEILRDQAAAKNVSIKEIATTLNLAFGEQEIATIYTTEDTYSVILQAQRESAKNQRNLDEIYVKSQSNEMVPLSSLVKIKSSSVPYTVNHLNRLTSATLSFNLSPGVNLEKVVNQIENIARDLPSTIIGLFQGSAEVFADSQKTMLLLLLAAILSIYIILGILYESYIHPLTILSGLPSAGVGALVFLWVLGFELDLISIIGLILLMGLAKKNAIIMIDYAISKQEELSAREAIYQACLRRFRPIMMTTFSALAGALPIAMGLGAGSELRKPLGIAVIGGLLVSQFITLFITPAIYLYFEQLKEKWMKKSKVFKR